MALTPDGRFVLEEGDENATIAEAQPSMLQESERDIVYFQEFFLGQHSPVGPVSVSLVASPTEYKAIFRTAKARDGSDDVASLKQSRNPSVPKVLLAAEERQVIRSYKIGVLYAKPGQRTEAELLSNQHDETSAAYRTFLGLIGQTITLRDWKSYRGGLNVAEDLTGTHSVYTRWQGYEIMFHVSTLLPYSAGAGVQLERKRHIGNDLVTVVFQEDDATPVDLASFDSKQIHVVVAVHPLPDQRYRLAVARRTGVPGFLPALPLDCTIAHDVPSRDFLLAKLINGERASYQAPDFAPKIARTRSALLRDIANESMVAV